jgi:uncharacterized protein (DUF1330 family)
MPAFCFFDILEVLDREKLDEYRKRVQPTVERYGGRYRGIGGACDVVEGSWQPVFPVIIEFPTLTEARSWYDSEDYRQLKALRLDAVRSNGVIFEGW